MHSAQYASSVSALFPPGVKAFETWGTVSPSVLLGTERESVALAAQKRQRDFAAGRICSRLGLTALGFDNTPLLVGEDRVPSWPSEVVGSISHTDGYCVSVVALKRDFAAIGVDAERIGRLEPSLWVTVMGEDELDWVNSIAEHERSKMATLIFSAKEAFYKCQYTMTKTWLDFADLIVEVSGMTIHVSVREGSSAQRQGELTCRGRFLFDRGVVVCGISLPLN